MFTFLEMLALVESESSFGAYVCHRRPGGSIAISDLVFCARVLCLKFKMGVKCNCTVGRQKEKRIRNQNLRGGRIVMPMFPFFFFSLPSTSGPGPKVP